MDNLKPLTIHLLLRYTEGIAFDRLKLGKASKISGDLRRSPEIVVSLRNCSDGLRKFPEVLSLPKITRTLPEISEDRPNNSEGLRQSPEISEDHRIFSKLFQVLDDRMQYLLCTSVVNVWSEALSCPFFQVYY